MSPFASARVTVKPLMRDDETSAPADVVTAGSSWAEVLGQWAVVAVDHGWLRLLAAGGQGLPPLFTPTTALTTPTTGGPALEPGTGVRPAASPMLIAIDVLGGTFALTDEVRYFAPDGLAWLPLGLAGHDEFVDWALDGGLEDTFAELRWPGWRDEIRFLAPDQGVSVHPPLWSEEGQDIARSERGVTPLLELVAAHHEVAAQLEGVADGEAVDLTIID